MIAFGGEAAELVLPLGPIDEVKRGVRGYVRGYNAYIKATKGGKTIPDPRCQGAEWVRPIEEIEIGEKVYRRGASSGIEPSASHTPHRRRSPERSTPPAGPS